MLWSPQGSEITYLTRTRCQRLGMSAGYLSVLIVLMLGCGDQPNEVSSTHSSPALATIAIRTFEIDIETLSDDGTQIAVLVTANDESAWSAAVTAGQADALVRRLTLSIRESAQQTSANDENAAGDLTLNPQRTILGRHRIDRKRIIFTPIFPLLPGEKYVARFLTAGLPGVTHSTGEPIELTYVVPEVVNLPAPQVVDVYPSSSIVPANHLKFYVLFSEPMQRGNIFQFLALKNVSQQQDVVRPFRHTELWSADGQRLTLWFHPGRQKTGVNLNVEIGPVLEAGAEYQLVVSGDWPARTGVPLGEDVIKDFRTGPADHRQPHPEEWLLSAPRPGTRDVFRCELHEPLDWALLHSAITIETEDGSSVAGVIEPGYGELSWNFEPTHSWQPGRYRLAIKSVLEDLAGNSIERPFEVDVTEAAPAAPDHSDVPPTATVIHLEFDVRD